MCDCKTSSGSAPLYLNSPAYLIFFLFVRFTIIQIVTSSEMCSQHLTHLSAYTLGAVDTHTHTHTWSSGHTHTHTPGAVDTHTHTHTHTHTWSSGELTLRRPGSSRGFGALLKGLTSVVDNSCRSRDSNPQPQVTSVRYR